MDSNSIGDEIADEASKFLRGKGHIDHLHAQWHEHEKELYNIAEKHGWTPEGLKLQSAARKRGSFLSGALTAANNGPFYTDGVGCNICGHIDPRAYEGPKRNPGKDFSKMYEQYGTDAKFNEIVKNENDVEK